MMIQPIAAAAIQNYASTAAQNAEANSTQVASASGSSGGLAMGGGGTGGAPFAGLISDTVGQVNQLEQQAHETIRGLMSGSGVDVHTATIAAENASMGFELALSVRNKAVQAYNQVMAMQF